MQIIKEEIRSDNPDLVSVIIPEHVEKVAFRAFGGCKNLKDLHIEGDLSRLSGWSEEAFEDCVCEEYYKKVRYLPCIPNWKNGMQRREKSEEIGSL